MCGTPVRPCFERAHMGHGQRPAVKPHKCPRCEMRFDSEHSRQRHVRLVHGVGSAGAELSRAGPSAAGPSRPVQKCIFCDATFPSTNGLQKHYRHNHPYQARYACPRCPAEFATADALNQHRRSTGQ